MEDEPIANGEVKAHVETSVPDSHLLPDSDTPETSFVFFRARWRLAYLLFFTFALLYMHRVNMSLAVVCMVAPDTTNVTAADIETPTRGVTPGTTINASYASPITLGTGVPNNACSRGLSAASLDLNPELDWDYTKVSFLLSCYFYGSFFTQIPAGRMADYFGGKHIITVTHFVHSGASMLIPVCSRSNFYLVLTIRIVIGLAGGAVIPVGIAMLNVWAPPNERATLIGFSCSGFFIGTIVSYLTSGLLCVYGFDNGWPTIFYFQGGLSFVLLCVWVVEAYSSPSDHPRITDSELQYIQTARKTAQQKVESSVPWIGILTSRPMWASIIVHFACNWGVFTLLINVPLFLEEVLQYGVRQNGFYSALPYVFCTVSTLASPKLAQQLIHRKILGHLFTRKLFTGASLIISGLALVATGHVSCEMRELAIVLLCVACFFTGTQFGGFLSNHAEFAGRHAGTVYGITNAGGVISALLASMTAGLLTPKGLQEEWQLVFYIAASINLVGTLAFCACASVQLEDWASVHPVLELCVEGDPLNTHNEHT